MIKPISLFTLFVLLSSAALLGQINPIGTPYIFNYNRENYDGSEQNWSAVQDGRGVMYFGNTAGIITFDGNEWEWYSLSGFFQPVYALAKNEGGVIYYGGLGDLGFLKSSQNGQLQFSSLLEEIPANRRKFVDIRKIICRGDYVFYLSRDDLFVFRNHKLTDLFTIRAPLGFIEEVNGLVFIHDPSAGLFTYQDNQLNTVSTGEVLTDENLAAMIPLGTDSIFIATRNRGFFLFNRNRITEIEHYTLPQGVNNITCAIAFNRKMIILGTDNSGVIFADLTGRILKTISASDGLIGNYVNGLFTDRDKNLWITANNGISYLVTNSPYSYYFANSGLNEPITCTEIYGNRLYAAGVNAIYSMPYESGINPAGNNRFIPMDKFPGATLQMEKISDKLWLSRKPGMVMIGQNHAKALSFGQSRPYQFIFPDKKDSSAIIATTDAGLVALNLRDHSFEKIPGFEEPCRAIALDGNKNIWVIGTKMDKVFQLFPDWKSMRIDRFVAYDQMKGLPGSTFTNLLVIKGKVNILAGYYYVYDPAKDRFSINPGFNRIQKPAFQSNADKQGNVWLFSFDLLARAVNSEGYRFDIIDTTYKRLGNYLVYHALTLPDGYCILSTNKGIVQYNPAFSSVFQDFSTVISEVRPVNHDTSLYHQGIFPYNAMTFNKLQDENEWPEIAFKRNSIRFRYTAPFFVSPEQTKFSYQLVGYEDEWSVWTSETIKEYTNLKEGRYTFRVKARNIYLQTSNEAQYSFTILPPWYRTFWSYLLYLAGISGIIASIVRLNTRRLRALNIRLETIVDERTREIEQKNEELEMQKEEILSERDNLSTLALRLKEVDDYKTRFFTNITHEFRTPLTLIIGPLQQLIARSDDESLKKTYKVMLNNASSLLELINQLLYLSKTQENALTPQLEYSDLKLVMEKIVHRFQAIAVEKDISLTYETFPGSIRFYFDKDIIEKILNNIISNALKFTSAGGEVKIALSLINQGRQARITIADTGEGIPDDQLDLIFNRFYQVTGSRGNSHEGAGIGLAFVKEMIEVIQGRIYVSSKLGQGTMFTILLPTDAADVEHDKIEVSSSNFVYNEDVSQPFITTEKDQPGHDEPEQEIILIVEDNEDMLAFIAEQLPRHFKIEMAANGIDGYEKAIALIPDLIITDVMMPEMDGLEMTEKLKQDFRTSHVPVLVLTARASDENRMEGLEKRADAYLTKPFNVRELTLTVRNLLLHQKELRRKYRPDDENVLRQSGMKSIDQKFLEQAIRLVENNMKNPDFSIEYLCKELAMARTTLHRKIKALTNQSTTEFINSVRLKHAALMIRQKNGNISEIAYETGFNSVPYFNTLFKQQYGVSPTEYGK